MPITEPYTSTPSAAAAANASFALRLHSGNAGGETAGDRLIPIPTGKLSVGSGPRCGLRLDFAGVQPLHCLLTCDGTGLRVRRWANDMLLNGLPLNEAELAVGDRLTVGSIELEVIRADDDAESSVTDSELIVDTAEPAVAIETQSSGAEQATDSQSQAIEAAAMSGRDANRLTRTRRRKLMSALRFHHQMGLQLERSVANLEQQMRETTVSQANVMADGVRLNSTLSALVDQVRDYRREQAVLEQLHSDWQQHSQGWESRFASQQQALDALKNGLDQTKSLGETMHGRGRKLLAGLQHGRESFRTLDRRLANLEQHSQESLVERDRLRAEMSKALEQQKAQETQAVAWNTVVDATDRLSKNYRQLVDENTRLSNEIKQLHNSRNDFAAEKAAATEVLARLNDQHKELQQRQTDFEQQRSRWQDELRDWEGRVVIRDQWAENFERELLALRALHDAPSVPSVKLKSLSDEVAALNGRQADDQLRSKQWESRVAECENRLAESGPRLQALEVGMVEIKSAAADGDLRQSLAALQQQLAELQTASEANSTETAQWMTLTEQLASLRVQQAEWEARGATWQSQVESCDTQFADLRRQLADVERSVGALLAEAGTPATPPENWTALADQVAALRSEQAELAAQRSTWEPQLQALSGQQAEDAKRLTSFEGELAGLATAHCDQASQVGELTSLLEQLAALQRQQGDFEQLRSDWQDQMAAWESQLQQQLQHIERFEQELQHLQSPQPAKSAPVTLASDRQSVATPSEPASEPLVDRWTADECAPADETAASARIESLWESTDIEESTAEIEESPTEYEPTAETIADEQSVEEVSEEPEPVRPKAEPPVSFLERYAGMFDDDGETPPAAPAPREMPRSTGPAQSEQHAEEHGDESVEDYMAKLMKRIRGDATNSSAAQAATIAPDDVEQSTVDELAAPVAYSSEATEAIVDEGPADLLNNIEELKPKVPVPQFAADMQALRALANHSTRHAIGVHTARKLRRNATTRFVIAVLAVAAGVYLLFYSSSWRSLQFAGACVALFAAAYWTRLTLSSLMRAIQVGAFQSFDDDGEDPLNPPLPIDVDRKA